jgi:NodT family efflux transporter outer membrane factor (OMF) lipoprotein
MRTWAIPCTAAAAALTVCGCKVGPDYHGPRVDMPGTWVSPTAAQPGAATQPSVAVVQPTPDIARWWSTFNDPVLESLVRRALESNLDIQIAASRVRQARLSRRAAESGLYPSVDTSGSYRRTDTGRGSDRNAGGSERSLYQAGLDASWELDIFGGVRRGVEASEADHRATVEDRRDVQVTLASEVALNYLDYRSLQRQLAISRDNLVTQQQSLDVTRRRLKAGFESGLDVANAESTVAGTEAQIPLQEAALRQVLYTLGVLLGREPGALLEELSAEAPIPATPPEVPVGLPSDLLRRRPDIRRAEAQLHAATARIGVAVADLYPRFSLTGGLSTSGNDVHALTNHNFFSWSIGPSFRWPLFAGGRLRASVRIQEEAQQQALLNYRATILQALQEVEGALVAFVAEQQHRRALVTAVEAERRAVDLSQRLYSQGEIEFVTVLVAQRGLYSSEDALVQSDRNVAQNLVALYKALGGGWEDGDVEPATEARESAPATPAPAATQLSR